MLCRDLDGGKEMKHPPYHLRMNKAVDRFIFIELLRELLSLKDGFKLEDATYCSLAGPFLEDHKLIYEFFPKMELVSVESNPQTVKRQRLHKFTSKVTINPVSLSEYLDINQPKGTEVFWLDYIFLGGAQLDEFGRVLERVNEGSVVKITVPCDTKETPFATNGDTYVDEESTLKRKRQQYLDKFVSEFSSFLSTSVDHSDFSRPKKHLDPVQSMIKVQSQRSLSAVKGDLRYQILSSSYYNDGTQMLSVAGIVVDKEKTNLVRSHFDHWEFKNLDWDPPKQIRVPALSLKERLKLEEHLPIGISAETGLTGLLGYLIEDDPGDSEDSLRQYDRFCRYYPVFAKVIS
jgi:hypothetical protein